MAEALGLFNGPAKPVIIAHSFGSSVGLTAMELSGERIAGEQAPAIVHRRSACDLASNTALAADAGTE